MIYDNPDFPTSSPSSGFFSPMRSSPAPTASMSPSRVESVTFNNPSSEVMVSPSRTFSPRTTPVYTQTVPAVAVPPVVSAPSMMATSPLRSPTMTRVSASAPVTMPVPLQSQSLSLGGSSVLSNQQLSNVYRTATINPPVASPSTRFVTIDYGNGQKETRPLTGKLLSALSEF